MKKNNPQKKENAKLNLRNEEIQEIIGDIPKWYLRYGISLIFLFLFITLIGSYFFKYPDTITSKVEITLDNIPASIISKATGRIEDIFVKDNQVVKKGEILALIANSANYNEVIILKRLLNSINNDFNNQVLLLPDTSLSLIHLGELQSYFSSFRKQYIDFRNFTLLNYHNKKIETIIIEKSQQNSYLEKQKQKLYYTNEQLIISKKQFYRDSLLYVKGIIAVADYEKSQNQYLQSKSAFESSNTEIISIEMQITRLNQTILDLQSQKLEQNNLQSNILIENYELLSSKISEWEKNYLIIAPEDGTVTFTHFYNNNQNVKTGDVVFTIIPQSSKHYLAKVQLPIQSSGIVKIGQKVIIKLDDFPYMEYGFLQGFISKISLIPENDYYFADIILPSKLITTYGKDISMKSNLKGTGEIITRNQRLIYKFIYPLKVIMDKNNL